MRSWSTTDKILGTRLRELRKKFSSKLIRKKVDRDKLTRKSQRGYREEVLHKQEYFMISKEVIVYKNYDKLILLYVNGSINCSTNCGILNCRINMITVT